jgi:hypothetical protein
MKRALVRQSAGLGDIIFAQKIYRDLISKGYEVIWPIIDQYEWLNDYVDIKYVSINSDFPHREVYHYNHLINEPDFLFIPLQAADVLVSGEKIMASKYKMLGMEYHDWQDYFILNRNTEKENSLYYEKLGLKDGEEYCVLLRNYGSPPAYLKWPVNYTGNLRTVELDFYENYTLFDWSKVLENAAEIHAVDSSINYLFEKLNLTKNIFLYSRRGNDFSEIDYMFKTPYNLVHI